MQVNLHGLDLVLESDSRRIRGEWGRLYAPFLADGCSEPESWSGQVCCRLHLALSVPSPPTEEPCYSQPDLAVYQDGGAYLLHLPRVAQLCVDPAMGLVSGVIAPAALDTYGAFEDINAIGLSPLFRRNGRVLIHAFAAAISGRAVLLVGDNASGKTTTGLSLLSAGWKLIANDATLLGEQSDRVIAYAYPGLLSAHGDALQRIPVLRPLLSDPAAMPARPGWKYVFDAQDHFPAPWLWEAEVAAVCLLQLDSERGQSGHHLTSISPAVAVGQLLPHSVDRWDQETLDLQIDLVHRLAQVPIYRLRLGRDVLALPQLMESLLGREERKQRGGEKTEHGSL